MGVYRHSSQLEILSARLYYGVKEDAIPLVVGVRGLGRVRARKIIKPLVRICDMCGKMNLNVLMESDQKWQGLLEGTVKGSDALIMALRNMAATLGVYDLMEVRVFLERSCRFVQERYRAIYVDAYMSMVVDSVLDLKAGFSGTPEMDDARYSLRDALKRLDEINAPPLLV